MPENRIKNVMIGTPCLDGRMDALYTYSLIESMKLCSGYNISLFPVFITRESLIQRARNDLLFYAHRSDISDIIFIDSDQYWKPEYLVQLLNHNEDIVGGTYRKKSHDTEEYVLKALPGSDNQIDENGLLEVSGLGTGFLKMSKKSIDLFWENKDILEYKGDDGEMRKMIFNTAISNIGDFMGEDIYMCELYRKLGGKVFLDTNITIGHIGTSNFNGSFKDWALKNNLIKIKPSV